MDAPGGDVKHRRTGAWLLVAAALGASGAADLSHAGARLRHVHGIAYTPDGVAFVVAGHRGQMDYRNAAVAQSAWTRA
jgi:NADPH-dependent curcumin reductase CurA